MKLLIALSVGTLVGAGALGFMSGLKVKDEILAQRMQATEDSIAVVAMANSEAALVEPDSLDGELPDSVSQADVSGDPDSAAGDAGEGGTPEVASQSESSTEPAASSGSGPSSGTPATQADAEALAAAEASKALAKETGDRLSKIFSEMKPGEAADVLSYLSDGEIERILLGIRERDAAAILAQLEPERAAAVSRRVLRPGGDV